MELFYEPAKQKRLHTPVKQLNAVRKLPPVHRFQHAVKEFISRREVWGLSCGRKWVLINLSDGKHAFPLWPTWEYAEIWLGHHSQLWQQDYAPRAIHLQELIHELLPLLDTEALSVATFFLPEENGIISSPQSLHHTIDTQLQEWFGDCDY